MRNSFRKLRLLMLGGVFLGWQGQTMGALVVGASDVTIKAGESGYVDILLTTGDTTTAKSYTVKMSLPSGGSVTFPWDSSLGDLITSYPLQGFVPVPSAGDFLTTLDSGKYLLGVNYDSSNAVTLATGAGLMRIPVVVDASATPGTDVPLTITLAQFGATNATGYQAGLIHIAAVPEPTSIGIGAMLCGIMMKRSRKQDA